MGENNPIGNIETEYGRWKNRRIDIKIKSDNVLYSPTKQKGTPSLLDS